MIPGALADKVIAWTEEHLDVELTESQRRYLHVIYPAGGVAAE